MWKSLITRRHFQLCIICSIIIAVYIEEAKLSIFRQLCLISAWITFTHIDQQQFVDKVT